MQICYVLKIELLIFSTSVLVQGKVNLFLQKRPHDSWHDKAFFMIYHDLFVSAIKSNCFSFDQC